MQNNDNNDLLKQFGDLEWGCQQLRNVSIFQDFKDAELTKLYQSGQIKKILAKSYVIIEGEPSRGIYIILSGMVSIFKNNTTNDGMFRLAHLGEGESFGEFSLVENCNRSASVAAESLCYLFYLDEKVFNGFLDHQGPDTKIRFYKRCTEELAARFRTQNEDYIHAQQLLWKHALALPKEKVEK